MAGSNNNAQAGGIFVQVQELIANYISNLEKAKFEDAAKATEEARVAKENKENSEKETLLLEESIKSKKSEVESVESLLSILKNDHQLLLGFIDELKNDVESANNAKKISAEQLEEIKSKIEISINRLKEVDIKISSRNEALKAIEQKIVEANKELGDLDNLIKGKNTQLINVNQNLNISSDAFEEYKKVNSGLLTEIKENQEAVNKTKEARVVAETEQVIYFTELDQKKKVANKELSDVLDEFAKFKEDLELQKKTAADEVSFNKQVSDLNIQKSKSLDYIKSKLKEIILKITLESDDNKVTELKSLLFMIEKL